ncbi:murein hydrolase activator EnvC family protein [Iodobacter fluviatilis]|uniref:Septal ring factor n=1 Tax=Iodobacter fluviatilis TaxID=537 RepID=A0A377Q5I8_9NEIS|nr:peptidoglycan DD-metalloendopeptidase family protein [Iodobacter fluviatilis]TCU90084.1 septal ring factor EnvC (AmiA/AmiB activator) [Iodobacter fluviatilis]STQ89111.1 Septal ring factor [Iodobacter fluviatilis]
MLTSCALAAPSPPAAPKQESEAKQAELKDLRGQLQELKKDLAANESQRSEASDALKDSETAISDANRVLSSMQQEQALTSAEISRLENDISSTRKGIQASQLRLGKILKTRYKAGQIEAWRLLLNQQDPNQVSRELTYYRYISRSQLQLANKLEAQLSELSRLSEDIRQKNEALQQLAQRKKQQKEMLVSEQQEKQQIVSNLSQEISSQRNQIQKLAADEKRLTGLVDKLNAIIKRQELERAKKAVQAKLLAEKKAKERAARNAAAQAKAKAAGKPAPKVEPEPEVTTALPDAGQSGQAFASLKGKLRLPIKGEITGRYGTARGEGGQWKGVFIRAASGQSVKAVASGRVVFADWLRGFGNMLIVDHGGGYMSIYAANESILKQVGDTIKAGDSIATSGNSGGMADSGLYFELRQNGRPVDPLAWAG